VQCVKSSSIAEGHLSSTENFVILLKVMRLGTVWIQKIIQSRSFYVSLFCLKIKTSKIKTDFYTDVKFYLLWGNNSFWGFWIIYFVIFVHHLVLKSNSYKINKAPRFGDRISLRSQDKNGMETYLFGHDRQLQP